MWRGDSPPLARALTKAPMGYGSSVSSSHMWCHLHGMEIAMVYRGCKFMNGRDEMRWYIYIYMRWYIWNDTYIYIYMMISSHKVHQNQFLLFTSPVLLLHSLPLFSGHQAIRVETYLLLEEPTSSTSAPGEILGMVGAWRLALPCGKLTVGPWKSHEFLVKLTCWPWKYHSFLVDIDLSSPIWQGLC